MFNIKHTAHIYIYWKTGENNFLGRGHESNRILSTSLLIAIWLRDCRQITFGTLNRFCLFSKTPPPPHPLFLTDNITMDRMPTKIKWKVHTFFYIVCQVLKVLLIKICKMQPADLLFLFVFISFYISRYSFFTNF